VPILVKIMIKIMIKIIILAQEKEKRLRKKGK